MSGDVSSANPEQLNRDENRERAQASHMASELLCVRPPKREENSNNHFAAVIDKWDRDFTGQLQHAWLGAKAVPSFTSPPAVIRDPEVDLWESSHDSFIYKCTPSNRRAHPTDNTHSIQSGH